jgi:hypothetical protein
MIKTYSNRGLRPFAPPGIEGRDEIPECTGVDLFPRDNLMARRDGVPEVTHNRQEKGAKRLNSKMVKPALLSIILPLCRFAILRFVL